MGVTAGSEAVAAALNIISTAQPRCGLTKVVAVDGPSGAGKTSFAAALAERLPGAQLLHMDDLYPGWNGLQRAVSDLHLLILAPLSRGEPAAYRRWSWADDRYGEWQSVPPTNLLLVEGVGSGASPGTTLESALIWLEADRQVRRQRGLDRDDTSYQQHWQQWASQEDDLFEVDRTRSRADLIMNTSDATIGWDDVRYETG